MKKRKTSTNHLKIIFVCSTWAIHVYNLISINKFNNSSVIFTLPTDGLCSSVELTPGHMNLRQALFFDITFSAVCYSALPASVEEKQFTDITMI